MEFFLQVPQGTGIGIEPQPLPRGRAEPKAADLVARAGKVGSGERAARAGGHCDPWALSPGMGSSRCPADTAAMGHLGTGISRCPNKTEVKTRLQHGQQGSRLWARVQIKTYRGRRHLSDTTVMLGDGVEKGIQQGTLYWALETSLELPPKPCIWGKVGFQSQGS